MDISLSKLDLVIYWDLNGPNKDCLLCKLPLLAPAPQELKTSGAMSIKIDGQIVMGECNHMFHKACMTALTSSGCMSCPIDMTVWKTQRILQSGAFCEKTNQFTIKHPTTRFSTKMD